MDNSRWKQIEEVFDQAIKLSADERERYLEAQDRSLREEIESLIFSYEEDPTFLQRPAFDRGLKVLADEKTNIFPGDKVGSYKIISKLGTGGMGAVYLAIDSRLGRKVAIKFLSQSLVEDRNRINRFRQEARAASKISHPNVAAIYEIGSYDENHFIAMEFVDGTTLRERLAQQDLPLRDALDIAIQVGLAIESAHALGIVHRDIKPENIMIRGDGYVKVLDFGLAKLTEAYQHQPVEMNTLDSSTMTGAIPTEPGFLMGTATYMSPEQARGLEVDGRTDIWSWGVVLYEMVAGEAPFRGATTSDVLADILRGEPSLFSSSSLRFPETLRDLLRRAMSKERQDRFATMSEAVNQLRTVQKQLEVEDLNLHKVQHAAAAESTLSTQENAQVDTGQSNVAKATEFHVIADNFRTIALQDAVISPDSGSVLKNPQKWRLAVVAMSLSVGLVLLVLVAIKQLRPGAASPSRLEFTKLSSEENISEAVISPDGKYIALVVEEAGLQSLLVRQTNTPANLRLVPPTKTELRGLAFSPEADSVYFLQFKDERWALYSVSVLGGDPRKLSENLETPVIFSPDGRRMAFVRPGANDSTVLITAHPDGTRENVLMELKGPEKFVMDLMNSTPAWSPDGKVIAIPTINEKESSREDVVAVHISERTMKRINRDKGVFARVRRLTWSADSNGLILTANVQHTAPYQIWTLSYSDGEIQNLTNDADDYVGLSATRDGRTLLTTKISTLSSVWVSDHTSGLRQIPSTNNNGTNGISWTQEGRIVYARNIAASCDLWVMDSDGTNRKQLTFDGQRNHAPTVSPDGRYLVFVSYREGRPHLWRVSWDGTGLEQLTNGHYEDTPIVSPDSKWIIYRCRNPSGLWRVSIDGGEPLPIIKEPAYFPDISPDGRYLAFLKNESSNWRLNTILLEDGTRVSDFATHPGFVPSLSGLRWTGDGTKITYVISANGVSNIWAQPITGGNPEQLTNFTEGTIFYFAWSNSGQLACARGTSAKELLLVKRPH